MSDGRRLVEAVREAARRHGKSWEALVPSPSELNLEAEDAEERAYAEMASAKRALSDHIHDSYGISVRELIRLVTP